MKVKKIKNEKIKLTLQMSRWSSVGSGHVECRAGVKKRGDGALSVVLPGLRGVGML